MTVCDLSIYPFLATNKKASSTGITRTAYPPKFTLTFVFKAVHVALLYIKVLRFVQFGGGLSFLSTTSEVLFYGSICLSVFLIFFLN